jgi:hypothetical protein
VTATVVDGRAIEATGRRLTHGLYRAETVPEVVAAIQAATSVVLVDPVRLPLMMQGGELAEEDVRTHFPHECPAGNPTDVFQSHIRHQGDLHAWLVRQQSCEVTVYLGEDVTRNLPLSKYSRKLQCQLLTSLARKAAGRCRFRLLPRDHRPDRFAYLNPGGDQQRLILPRQDETWFVEGIKPLTTYQDTITELDHLAMPEEESAAFIRTRGWK